MVVFVRMPKGPRKDKRVKETQIVLFDLGRKEERVIVQGCTYEGEKADIDYGGSKEYPFVSLCWLSHPLFSIDDEKVYFTSEAWATSPAIHCYSLDTGKVSFFSGGDLREVRPDGSVVVSRTGPASEEKGRYVQDWLFTKDGKIIRPIGEKSY